MVPGRSSRLELLWLLDAELTRGQRWSSGPGKQWESSVWCQGSVTRQCVFNPVVALARGLACHSNPCSPFIHQKRGLRERRLKPGPEATTADTHLHNAWTGDGTSSVKHKQDSALTGVVPLLIHWCLGTSHLLKTASKILGLENREERAQYTLYNFGTILILPRKDKVNLQTHKIHMMNDSLKQTANI